MLRRVAAVAIATFVFKLDLSRGFVVIAFGVGIIALLLGRFFLRVWLRHERRFGHYLHKTLVVGSRSEEHTSELQSH